MGALPQLFMRNTHLDNLKPLVIPKGFTLHTHVQGNEDVWEKIIESAFGTKFSFQKTIVEGGGYKPEYVLYVSKDGVDIATATAVEKADFPGEGWFRMIGTSKEARGLGAGKLVCLAALYSLAQRGYKSTVLSTDDSRIPAISMYLSLGFEPLYTHESHKERWDNVMKEINKNKIKI
ncbi:MAG: GNAT family N-acetyltransferase [Bacillota bacterium]|nr:GNAT family N-acetyltransferase [Bacillota bacterium]